jgi:hypothetical protein
MAVAIWIRPVGTCAPRAGSRRVEGTLGRGDRTVDVGLAAQGHTTGDLTGRGVGQLQDGALLGLAPSHPRATRRPCLQARTAGRSPDQDLRSTCMIQDRLRYGFSGSGSGACAGNDEQTSTKRSSDSPAS